MITPRAFLPAAALFVAAMIEPVAAVEIQGHRGARGLLPENTLPAFAGALSIGVDVIELDTAISSDGVVMVSHDPELTPYLTRGPDGRWLEGAGPIIATLTVDELKRFDVGRIQPGSDYAGRYPEQSPVDGAVIPTLSEVAALADAAGNRRVRFNVEIKMRPDGRSTALSPEAFADRVVETVRAAGISERTIVQSFYWRSVARVQAAAPEIATACLTSEQSWLDNIGRGEGTSPWTGLDVARFGGSVPRMVEAAGCKVWSPFFREVDDARIREARELGLKVVVWTVNASEDMKALIDLGVDGIITDYPDRLRRILEQKGMPVPEPTPVTAPGVSAAR